MNVNPLGYHVNTWTDAARGSVRATAPAVLVVLNTAASPDDLKLYKEARPDGLVVFRDVWDVADWFVTARVDRTFHNMDKIAQWVDVVCTPWNEMYQAGTDILRYADATIQAVNIIEERGYSAAIGHFSEGNPSVPDFVKWANFAMVPSRRPKWFSYDGYSAPTMQTDAKDRTLRVEQLYDAIDARLRRDVLWKELGLDGGAEDPPLPRKGWRTLTSGNAEAYGGQLRWTREEIIRIGYKYGIKVKAAIYCNGNFGDWNDFDVAAEGPIESVVKEIMSNPIPPIPAPTPQPTLDIGGFKKAGAIIGPFTESQVYEDAGSDHEAAKIGTPKGLAFWYKANNEIVVYEKASGALWRDWGNHGDGTLKKVSAGFLV